jgi:folate-binding protein YgfZ
MTHPAQIADSDRLEAHPDSQESVQGSGAAGDLAALLGTVGVCGLDEVGWIRVTGSDRVRWLNGMVTNSIQELKPRQGNYSFALNAQGRIQGDLVAFADEGESLLIETAKDRVPELMALLDHYIIMDDVELEDVSPERCGLALAGPRAEALLAEMGLTAGADAAISKRKSEWRGAEVEVIRAHGPLVPRFELWADAAGWDELSVAVTAAAVALGGDGVGAQAMEWLRLLEGTPRYGVDIREKELPQETGQTRALHFAKGCYLGQEIVERIRSRGNVHRQFSGFRLDGQKASVGSAMVADGKPVGELTSVATIPLPSGSVQLGLGYVRREAVERGLPMTYGEGAGTAALVALPYRF